MLVCDGGRSVQQGEDPAKAEVSVEAHVEAPVCAPKALARGLRELLSPTALGGVSRRPSGMARNPTAQGSSALVPYPGEATSLATYTSSCRLPPNRTQT